MSPCSVRICSAAKVNAKRLEACSIGNPISRLGVASGREPKERNAAKVDARSYETIREVGIESLHILDVVFLTYRVFVAIPIQEEVPRKEW